MKAFLKLSDRSRRMLRRMPDAAVPALAKGMRQAMIMAEGTARGEYLSGRALKRRTGRLRGSITHDVRISGDKVTGRIGSRVIYARIHELGGEIVPRQAKALRFHIPGVGWRTAKRVRIPARPFLRPSIEDNLDDITRVLAKRVEEAFENVG